MRQVKFTEDFEYNTDGSAHGKQSNEAGDVIQCGDDLAQKLVNVWQVAQYHDVRPSETKPMRPQEHKATYTLNEKGAGWYELIDEDGDVVDKIRGEENAQSKLDELNG